MARARPLDPDAIFERPAPVAESPSVPQRLGGNADPTSEVTLLPLVLPAASVVHLQRLALRRGVTLAALVQGALDRLLKDEA